MKQITLCADDYGQNEDISQGIRDLCALARLNAVSCMTTLQIWPKEAAALLSCHTHQELGLHFNLTEGPALSPMWRQYYGVRYFSLKKILFLAYTRQLRRDVVMDELSLQWMNFCQYLGKIPDFIDGHQHIHQYPVIRDLLFDFLEMKKFRGWIRVTSANGHSWCDWKTHIIRCLGGKYLRKSLENKHYLSNSSFSGIYSFHDAIQYRQYFRRFLSDIGHHGLIMCHPGRPSVCTDDSLSPFRHHEWRYFLSDFFMTDMAAYGCQLRSVNGK